MVNVAAPTSERLSTKALAAAGQFRAIALWLNEPLIPQGIYVQVRKDKRQGCLLIVAEFERPPEPQRLTQYICHLIWQLNSPLIEGIHLIARPVGESKMSWARRVRVMTPALREQINRLQGKGSRAASIPPQITQKYPPPSQTNKQRLFADQIKTLRALMLTGSAVAAFVFGCLVEVLLSAGQEPSLPFENRQAVETEVKVETAHPLTSPQLPNLPTVLADYEPKDLGESGSPEAIPVAEAVVVQEAVPYSTHFDRPNYVHGALEPVGVMEHGRIPNPTEPTVTLIFGGDVRFDDLPYSDYEDDSQLLAGVAAYQQADVAMVNLNDSLATADTSLEEKFLDRQRPDAINLLKEGGVDIVNLTSEHTLAYGEQGLTETLDVLDSSGIYRVGAGRNEREARRPEVLDVKGKRIAYLSYDQAAQQSADASLAGINVLNKQAMIEDIGAIRDEVDWLVVNFRWTEEIPEKAADFQTNLARLAIDKGADLVVGHHPTQLQGGEIYKGRPIAYSLGDFVFGQSTAETTAESAMLQVSLSDRQMKVDLIPVKVEAGQPQRVQGIEAENVLAKIEAASQEFETPLASSVVLDARSPVLTEPDAPQKDTPFVEGKSSEADHSQQLRENNPANIQLNVPLEANDPLNIDVDPISDELLKDWGPKQGAGTLYQPESALPSEARPQPLPPSEASEATSQDQEPSQTGISATSSSDKVESESEPATEATDEVPDGAIAPYSEPLVGPLGALPAPASVATPATTDSTIEAAATEIEVIPEPVAIESTVVAEPVIAAESSLEEASTIPAEAEVIEAEVIEADAIEAEVVEVEVIPLDSSLEMAPEDSLQEISPAAIPLVAQQQLGLHQPRVLKPLNAPNAAGADAALDDPAIDVKQ